MAKEKPVRKVRSKLSTQQAIDYKDARTLAKFVSEHGKITPRRMSGVNQKQQKQITQAIKRARIMGFLGFTSRFDGK